jgi:hypothetical protein
LIKPVSPQTLKETIEAYTKKAAHPRRFTILNLTFGFALLLGLGMVMRGQLHKQHCVTVNNSNILNSSAIGFDTRDGFSSIGFTFSIL